MHVLLAVSEPILNIYDISFTTYIESGVQRRPEPR